MNCPNCNNPLQPHQRFCPACGTRVEALTSDAQQAAEQWQPQEVQPEPQQAEWRPQEVQPEPQQAEWRPQSVQPEPQHSRRSRCGSRNRHSRSSRRPNDRSSRRISRRRADKPTGMRRSSNSISSPHASPIPSMRRAAVSCSRRARSKRTRNSPAFHTGDPRFVAVAFPTRAWMGAYRKLSFSARY